MATYIEYKAGQKFAPKNAETSDTPDSFRDCGVLLEPDEVVIDIDCLSKEQIQKLISTFSIQTKTVWTDRGCHLYFKRPESLQRVKNGTCALGFDIEMKTPTNSPNGLTIKRNGVLRRIENENTLQELPWFFSSKTRFRPLLGMTEGDGRNSALMVHRGKLADRKGWKDILSFINTTIFDTPLPQSEFETVTREMSNSNSPKAEEYEMAELVMQELRCVNYMNLTWWFNGSEFIADKNDLKLKQRVYRKCVGKPTKYVDEVIKQVKYRCPIYSDSEEFAIRFNNGVLMPDGNFIYAEYTEFTPYHVDIDYNPEAKPVPIVDEYIANLTDHDEAYRNLLLEALGFSFVTNRERIRSLGKFFIFRGDGRNGKGTLLAIIRHILNPKNCTSLKIKQLTDHTYAVSMIGKLANLGDDLDGSAIKNDQMEVLKNISTSDTMSIRQMYKEGEDVVITAKLYFTTNSNIKSFEKNYAYQRRVVWLPMFNTVDKPDPYFITKLTTPEALEYWIRLLMEGYQRLMTTGEWTMPDKVREFNEQYHETNNIMRLYIDDRDPELDFLNKKLPEIKSDFLEWAEDIDDNIKWSRKLFLETLWTKAKMGIGIRSIGGNKIRCILKQTDTKQDLTPRY